MAQAVMFDGLGVKALTADGRVKAAGAPEPGDLELINSYALVPLKASDVAVYTMQVANNLIDRDNERFSTEVLADFAVSLVGKSLLCGHDWSAAAGVGRFFRAWVETENGTTWLMAKAYMLRADEEAAGLITKLDGGVASFVSVGFYCPTRTEMQDGTGNSWHEYRRGPGGEPAEAIEASIVFLGAQYDAQVIKSVTDRLRAARDKAHTQARGDGAWDVLKNFAARLLGKQGRVLSEANLQALKQAVDMANQSCDMIEKVIAAAVPAEPAQGAGAGGGFGKPEGEGKAVQDDTAAGAAPEAAGAAAATPENKGDDDMTPEQIEQFKAEIKALIEAAVTGFKAQVDELTAKVTAMGDEQVKQAEQLKAVDDDALGEDFGVKVLDRLENIEAVLGAPQAAPEPDADKGNGDKSKGAKGTKLGDLLIPSELRG